MDRDACKRLWEGNREYVTQQGDRIEVREACALAKKQDALYLAWADGDFSGLKPIQSPMLVGVSE